MTGHTVRGDTSPRQSSRPAQRYPTRTLIAPGTEKWAQAISPRSSPGGERSQDQFQSWNADFRLHSRQDNIRPVEFADVCFRFIVSPMNPPRQFVVDLFDEVLKDQFVVKADLSLYYELIQQSPPSGFRAQLKRVVQQAMRRLRMVRVEMDNQSLRSSLNAFAPYWHGLQELYELLANEASRALLVKLIAHRILGAMHVTLPADTPRYRELYRRAQSLEDRTDSLETGSRGWRLYRMNLQSYGYPITLYGNASLALATFGMTQYEYGNAEAQTIVGARPGDLVIDAGGCWGDTALFFANRVGPEGSVLTFEFDPRNLQVLEQNLALNPEFATRVTVIQQPLWEEAELPLSTISDGPASRTSPSSGDCSASTMLTSTIDQAVQARRLGPVGLIKMDIEGAEQPVLRGAIQTLKRDRPRLAISLYHSMDDMVQIPRWIADLDLGYRFYLGHETIFDAETVLFAVAS